ncbi:MAG TPA: alpha/beta hydrolase [Steroidobacteraceae bacterium]|jgi:hypothetical protein
MAKANQRLALCLSALLTAPTMAHAELLRPGLYRNDAGHLMYIGVENSQPDPPVNQYFDPKTQRMDDLRPGTHLLLQTGIGEDRRVIDTPQGPIGASLYYKDVGRRGAIILIHGNDPETRDMGFLIPYFVLNGINVISFDQRGTGDSSGNWQQNGPAQRAIDAEALYDAFAADARIDAKKVGIWAFSNGGWTAPIIATERPLAFMILKSAPAESIEANVYYSVEQRMRHKNHDAASVAAAIDTWHTIFGALAGKTSWEDVRAKYTAASSKPWFSDSLIPFFFSSAAALPPPADVTDGMRREILYDPGEILQKVRTPTLALFGAYDRNVDIAFSIPRYRAAFHAAKQDFTLHIYKNAGHTLKVSTNGFDDSEPERLTAGYPQIMLQWLRRRGFLHH